MNTLADRIELIYREHPDLEGEKGQVGLARLSGASRSVVSQWIRGEIRSLNIDYALALEAALGYSHLWLMLGGEYAKMAADKEKARPAAEAHRPRDPHYIWAWDDEQRLLDYYRLMDARDKERVMRTAASAKSIISRRGNASESS